MLSAKRRIGMSCISPSPSFRSPLRQFLITVTILYLSSPTATILLSSHPVDSFLEDYLVTVARSGLLISFRLDRSVSDHELRSPWLRQSKLSMRRFAPTQSPITFARHVRSSSLATHCFRELVKSWKRCVSDMTDQPCDKAEV